MQTANPSLFPRRPAYSFALQQHTLRCHSTRKRVLQAGVLRASSSATPPRLHCFTRITRRIRHGRHVRAALMRNMRDMRPSTGTAIPGCGSLAACVAIGHAACAVVSLCSACACVREGSCLGRCGGAWWGNGWESRLAVFQSKRPEQRPARQRQGQQHQVRALLAANAGQADSLLKKEGRMIKGGHTHA